MTKLNKGDKVKIHFELKLDDGQIIDSTYEADPEMIEIDDDDLHPDFNKAVKELEIGGKANFTISAEDAYGFYNEELLYEIPRADVPEELELKEGLELELEDEDGEVFVGHVVEIKEDVVMVDTNSPLAGHNLNYQVELMEIIA